MDRKLIAVVLACLLIGTVIGFAIGFTSKIQSFLVDYSALNNKYTQLQNDYEQLEDDYSTLQNQHSQLEEDYATLNEAYTVLLSNYSSLHAEYTQLKENYTWLKQHSFTYYTVGDALNMSLLEIEEEDGFWGYTTISGNITNISNNAIEEVYVYALLRNPDGTMFFSYYDSYDRIVDLYIGETASFEIGLSSYVEGQKVEIWLVF